MPDVIPDRMCSAMTEQGNRCATLGQVLVPQDTEEQCYQPSTRQIILNVMVNEARHKREESTC